MKVLSVTVPDTIQRRRRVDRLMTGVLAVAIVLAITPLALILGDVIIQGAPALNLSFFTNLPGHQMCLVVGLPTRFSDLSSWLELHR